MKSRKDLELEVKILRKAIDHLLGDRTLLSEEGKCAVKGFLAGAGIDYTPPVIMQ